jgi:hypothetical protein
MLSRLTHAIRGFHPNYTRHPLGGFRCIECGRPGATLADLGFGRESGFVLPMRRLFSREGKSIERARRWE